MIYLDNAATSFPKPPGVAEAVGEYLSEYSVSSGRSSYPAAVKVSKKIFTCRQNIAKLFNISDASRIVFTLNATAALNTALKGILRKNSTALISSLEHNAIARPLNYLKETKNINILTLKSDKDGYIIKEDLENKLAKKIDIVAVNHASNVFGLVQDIKTIGAICKKHGTLFMVDAAQTAGEIKIDVKDMNIDILAASGHKGLLSPAGVGFLYLRKGIEFPPLVHGGTGSNSEQSIQPKFWPDKMESGTLNIGSIIGLEKSTEFILKRTVKEISEKKSAITSYLIQNLNQIKGLSLYGPDNPGPDKPRSDKKRTSPVSFNIAGKTPSEIAEILNKKNICVRTGLHCAPMAHKFLKTYPEGTVRASAGYFTKEKEIDRLIATLKSI
ncbi:MAG: aminotransferase class V-fold PLP-dependent enzyme [Elusimicrobia bacterium]|jgi:cysteine desulfurase/selenocysteine lyase|nr:aminotransferase class V-fold PLP-dependent enzyme [Elusimicrobiota bacterium]